jgi:CPA2 family monovalent cation:H+ antiporter-2
LFSPWVALIGATISCLILALFSKIIKAFYAKIELTFLNNFHERETKMPDINEMLSPWDTHIANFELNAQSPLVGKTLSESKIREEFGVNIVVIERGELVINIPTHSERLYPYDKLFVTGTDEQLEKFKLYLDSTVNQLHKLYTKQKVSLQHFTISDNSALAGQNISGSRIRERFKALIVGIERNGERILNPESDFVFEKNDKIWIVGNEKRIMVLIHEISG